MLAFSPISVLSSRGPAAAPASAATLPLLSIAELRMISAAVPPPVLFAAAVVAVAVVAVEKTVDIAVLVVVVTVIGSTSQLAPV